MRGVWHETCSECVRGKWGGSCVVTAQRSPSEHRRTGKQSNKKVDLIAWATFNRDTLTGFQLVATRHTARLLRDKVGLEVEELLSGPEGGDAQIAARVATGAVDTVFFFVDPLSAQPHDPDIRALLRVCNVHNIPLATNVATADLIITALTASFEIRPGPEGEA